MKISMMIGDKDSDMKAAKKSGVKDRVLVSDMDRCADATRVVKSVLDIK
jgi:histidinol phosphatase-like enzyme